MTARNRRGVGLREQIRILTSSLSSLTESKSITLSAAFEEWLKYNKENSLSHRTAERNELDCRSFVNSIASNDKVPLTNITAAHINAWLNSPGRAKVSTRKVWLCAVRAFFRYCIENQYCQVDPSRFSIVRVDMRKMDHQQKEPRYQAGFTDEDVEKMLVCIQKKIESLDGLDRPLTECDLRFFRCAIPIARWAGLRISDICKLEWACFSQPNKIIVWTGKRNRRVELPMHQRVIDAVAAIEIVDLKHCFPRQRELVTGPLRTHLTGVFASICKGAKLQCTSFHQLRHAFAKDCFNRGVHIPHIASALGHMNTSTTEIYTTHHEKPHIETQGNPVQSLGGGGGGETASEGVHDHHAILPGQVLTPQIAA